VKTVRTVRSVRSVIGLVSAFLASFSVAAVAQEAKGIQHGVRPGRFAIRNAIVIEGNGTPAAGPYDIVIEGNTIADVVALDPVALKAGRARRPAADAEIDAAGRY